ncbi:helix-turn-helix domain-containing protein [Chitinophaga arvensicola]|uniref:DNA binding domain-containing protein, excisionase family n=1 Tax=Chitinophaga arvensicola TaxID=29529 RepID=A0A1I0S9I9_9BACT|nr:helix-turn-helix domain-containing protein [Chitinophaga arvensicola]SEW52839.1 DNA binding domain-containing protein, excisionase family [Chitinophaga arvensicola]
MQQPYLICNLHFKLMVLEILTKEEFLSFKKELFEEIRDLAKIQGLRPRKLLKSYEVCETLGISYGTLRKMKNSGILSSTKIGGLIYFDDDEIQKLTEVINQTPNPRS